MGILDGLLGTKTTSAQQNAAQIQDGYLFSDTANNDKGLNNALGTANGYLNTGATNATGAINAGYGNAQDALTGYGQMAQQQLASGTAQAVNSATAGNAAYQPAATTGAGASTMLGNALGLNGAGGTAAAQAAFTASPGYQFQVDQATNGAARQAASLGIANSGNTLDAITRLGSNLANTEYQTYLGNLSNTATQGLTAASGISTNDRAAATLQGTAATTGSQLSQLLGSSLGSSYQGQGTALGNIDTNLGTGLSTNTTNTATQVNANDEAAERTAYNSAMGVAQNQDAAQSANNGIFSGLIGSVGKSLLSGIKL